MGASLNLLSNFVGKTPSDDLAKVNFLRRHLPYAASSDVRMQLLCDIAIYFSQMDKHEEARRVMRQVEAVYQSHQEEPNARHYFHLVSGKINLLQGRPKTALRHLKTATGIYAHNPKIFIYQAQAALRMGEQGECDQALQQALDLVADSPFIKVRQRVHRSAQQLLQ